MKASKQKRGLDLVGRWFDQLEVIEPTDERLSGEIVWNVMCHRCKTVVQFRTSYLIHKNYDRCIPCRERARIEGLPLREGRLIEKRKAKIRRAKIREKIFDSWRDGMEYAALGRKYKMTPTKIPNVIMRHLIDSSRVVDPSAHPAVDVVRAMVRTLSTAQVRRVMAAATLARLESERRPRYTPDPNTHGGVDDGGKEEAGAGEVLRTGGGGPVPPARTEGRDDLLQGEQ